MLHPLVEKWETTLQDVFDLIDEELEVKYGDKFPLRANRPSKGKGTTPDTDGLFELAVTFSAGLRSELGPGYVFRVRLATLAKVPEDFRKQVEQDALARLRIELPKQFPDKDLKVGIDGQMFKIYGDLSLE